MMRKISLVPYQVNESESYDVRGSLVTILFSNGLGPDDLIEHDRIAKKIENTENNEVLLDENEYNRIVFCVNSFPKGFGRNDLEFVTRIMNAEEIASFKED